MCWFVCTMRLCRAAMHKGELGIHTISFCVLAETHTHHFLMLMTTTSVSSRLTLASVFLLFMVLPL